MEVEIMGMSEYEEKILEDNDIDFIIDNPFDLNNRDVNVVCSQSKFEKILKMIGRTCSYPN